MAFLTENQLSNTLDLPIALPATDLRMGGWIAVATVYIAAPMQLTYQFANVQIISSSVDNTKITSGNKSYGNLGLVYLALRPNYTGGSPGAAGGIDAVVATDVGVFSRDTSTSVVITTPGNYTWLVASNMQPSTDSSPLLPPSTSIDFRVAVSGVVRLTLDNS